jgi:hypothetical protein
VVDVLGLSRGLEGACSCCRAMEGWSGAVHLAAGDGSGDML